jgi:hypothetical protein
MRPDWEKIHKEEEERNRIRLNNYTAGVFRDYNREMARPDRTYNKMEEAQRRAAQQKK